MEEPKGWREFCSMAGTAILKYETDQNEPLEVTIFADRTTCRVSLLMASFKCGNRQYTCFLSGNADSDTYEDSILWHMVDIANAFHDNTPNEQNAPAGAKVQKYKDATRNIWEYRFSQAGRIFVQRRDNEKPLILAIDPTHSYSDTPLF